MGTINLSRLMGDVLKDAPWVEDVLAIAQDEIAGVNTGVVSARSIVRNAEGGSDDDSYRKSNQSEFEDVDEARKKKKLSIVRAAPYPNAIFILGEGDQFSEGWVTINGRHVLIGDDEHKALLGAAIFRDKTVDNIVKVGPLFANRESVDFEKAIPEFAKSYGVHVDHLDRAAGVWQSKREPSYLVETTFKDEAALDAYASKLGSDAPERQMAVARFIEDPKGKGALYEFHNVKDEEVAVHTLLKHGFDGQTVPLGSNRILLFDVDGSRHGNVDSAAKELGLTYLTTPGHVRFIEENEYKSVQNEYRKSKGQPTEESDNRDASNLQKAARSAKLLAEALERLTEGTDDNSSDTDGGHWVTLAGGQHILIGGAPQTPEEMEKRLKGLVQGRWAYPVLSDYQKVSKYFSSLNQDQLVEAHAMLQKMQGQSNFEKHILPILASRLDNDHAEKIIAQGQGKFADLTKQAIAQFGPQKTAEKVISESPEKYPLYSKDQKIAQDELVDTWNYSGWAPNQIRMQYQAGNMDGNRGQMLLNYYGENTGVRENGVPTTLRETMQARYDATQKYYADKGVDEVTVYRGSRGQVITPSALETWTESKDAALRMAGDSGYLFTATAPRSSIFWSADSEPRLVSALHPQEVTVFGAGIKVKLSARAYDIAPPEIKADFDKDRADAFNRYAKGYGMDTEYPFADEGGDR